MTIYKAKTADSWYFPRPQLAERFLDLFEASGASALTLFAERRIGKTSFLTNDLGPVALRRGYVPIYVDCWEVIGDATEALLDVLDQTLQEIQLPKSRLGTLLKRPVNAVTWADFGIEFGDAVERKKPRQRLMQIRWYLSQIIARIKRPIVLMLDEFQQVALDTEGEKLAASLRSALQRLHPAVRVIFSGSSESRLAEMFRRTRAPLFEFSSHMPFPPLERDFVRFIAAKYQAVTHRALDEALLWRAFLKFDRHPKPLKDLVLELMKSPSTDIKPAIAEYAQRVIAQRDEAIKERLKGLKPLDRLVLQKIAGAEGPTGKVSLRSYAEQLGVGVVHPNSATRSLKKLTDLDLIGRWADGSYRVADEALLNYLKAET